MERIASVTLGTSSLGTGIRVGSAEEDAAVETARALLTGPFARIDTANSYAGGRSEELLGMARRKLGDLARAARIVTKVDADPGTGALDRERVLRSYEESLTRLGVDRIELLHLHDPYTISFREAEGSAGAIAGMRELRDTGAVDAIGIAAGPIPLMLGYVRTQAFDAVLTHNRYTLIDRTALPLLTEARSMGMTIFNAAPFGAGILATGVVPGARYGYRPVTAPVIEWAERAQEVCDGYGIPLAAAALHFSIRSPFVDSTVVGVRTVARLRELEELVDIRIPDELWAEFDEIGPTPSLKERGRVKQGF